MKSQSRIKVTCEKVASISEINENKKFHNFLYKIFLLKNLIKFNIKSIISFKKVEIFGIKQNSMSILV